MMKSQKGFLDERFRDESFKVCLSGMKPPTLGTFGDVKTSPSTDKSDSSENQELIRNVV